VVNPAARALVAQIKSQTAQLTRRRAWNMGRPVGRTVGVEAAEAYHTGNPTAANDPRVEQAVQALKQQRQQVPRM